MSLHTTVLVFLCFLLQWAVSQRSWKQLVSAGVWFDYFGWSCVEPRVGQVDPCGCFHLRMCYEGSRKGKCICFHPELVEEKIEV